MAQHTENVFFTLLPALSYKPTLLARGVAACTVFFGLPGVFTRTWRSRVERRSGGRLTLT